MEVEVGVCPPTFSPSRLSNSWRDRSDLGQRLPMRTSILAGSLLLLAATASAQQLQSEAFTWAGDLERGGRVHIRNVRGSIAVHHVAGDRVSIVGDKRWRRSSAAAARIETRRYGSDLVICALFAGDTNCTPLEAAAPPQGTRRNVGDIVVDLVVRVPRGTPIRVVTLNGDVSIETASNDVDAQSVNGNVSVRTAAGSVYAGTVNGGVTAVLVPPVNADVELTTMHGSLSSEFPIQVRGRMESRRIHGRIARGGRLIRLTTINGNLYLLRGG